MTPNELPSHLASAPTLTPPFLASTDAPSLSALNVLCTPSVAVLSSTPTSSILSDVLEAPIVMLVGGIGSRFAMLAAFCAWSPPRLGFWRVEGTAPTIASTRIWIANTSASAAASTLRRTRSTTSGIDVVPLVTSIWITLRLSLRNPSTAFSTSGGSFAWTASGPMLPIRGGGTGWVNWSEVGAAGSRARARVTAALPWLRCSASSWCGSGAAAGRARSPSRAGSSGWRSSRRVTGRLYGRVPAGARDGRAAVRALHAVADAAGRAVVHDVGGERRRHLACGPHVLHDAELARPDVLGSSVTST